MTTPLLPDDMWAVIEPLLPAERPKPRGGWPGVPDRVALTGILFVLRSGLPCEMLPQEMSCSSGMTCWRRLRDKKGSKRHLVVDHGGAPLAVTQSAANVHDAKMSEATVDAIALVKGPRGRPRQRPAKLHADKGYDYPHCRAALRRRHIIPRIARRGVESSERLGRHRWVVERTLAWLSRFRRLRVRYERRADIHQAFLGLGCALICWYDLRALGRVRKPADSLRLAAWTSVN